MSPSRRTILAFRDKLLLPSEGFIKDNYRNFNTLEPVYVASKLGWRADELDGIKLATARNSFERAVFNHTGAMFGAADMRSKRPIAVHAHFGRGGALALPMARQLGLPLYVTYYGGDATKHTHTRRRLVPTIYQRRASALREYAAGFLCVSRYVADRLAGQGFPAEKLHTHYLGIDLSAMRSPAQRSGPLLVVGRFVQKKGIETLLSALHLLREKGGEAPRLDIVGSGGGEAALRAMAVDLPSVRFLGWQTPDQLAQHLATCSALVVPSREADDGDCEGLPTIMLEGSRAGAPVIGTAHAGIPEFITDGETGLLVPENDPPALAAAITLQLENAASGPKMAANAQKRLRQDFDAAIQSAKLEALLIAGTQIESGGGR